MYKHTHTGAYEIAIHNGKILLVKKQRGPYKGKWDLPGGGIEMGENSIDVLNREFGEECGYSIEKTKLVDVINSRVEYVNEENKFEELTLISIVYIVSLKQYEIINSETIIRGTEDISDSKWIDIDKVKSIPHTSVINAILKGENLRESDGL